ncbi:MAG: high-affinity branched-chain amino acid ABC transporter permease LivM [Proteobacteria bacterium]|nr:high-affinity branched-chain amino acid ABC transporter permease LivM [Pseudomonadota bacterium]
MPSAVDRLAVRGAGQLAGRLRDAAAAAFVTLVLALPLVGLRTVDQGGALVLETRWDWVAIGVAAVFVGRLALGLFAHLRLRVPRVVPRVAQGVAMPWLAWAVAGFAVALPFLPFADRYVIDLGTTLLIYVMLGWGLNVVVGLAGLLDLGYVAFYAVGAYAYALLALNFSLSFWICLPLAGLLAALFGIALGFPVLRLRGDYLAIVTLGFGEMVRIILINWQSLTNGPNGLPSIPRPSFFGLPFERAPAEGTTSFHQFFGLDFAPEHRLIFLYLLILALALLTNVFVLRLRRLPLGRAWEALREDEIACRALGINPTNVKLSAFAIGAMLGGFAGAFFATRQGFISPESFTFIESATIVAIVVLGGMGSQIGVVLAAAFLVLLPEIGREFAQFRMLVFGLAMILIMIWRPQGLLGHREPTVRLGRAAAPRP